MEKTPAEAQQHWRHTASHALRLELLLAGVDAAASCRDSA